MSNINTTTPVEIEVTNGGFQPLGDRVLVKQDEAQKIRPSGLIIPDGARERPFKGTVLATGPGMRDLTGAIIPIQLQAGDVVLFGRWAGVEVRINGDDYLIVKEGDILGRVRQNGGAA